MINWLETSIRPLFGEIGFELIQGRPSSWQPPPLISNTNFQLFYPGGSPLEINVLKILPAWKSWYAINFSNSFEPKHVCIIWGWREEERVVMSHTTVFVLESKTLTKIIGTSKFVRWQVTGRMVVRDNTKVLPKRREFHRHWWLWKK